MIKIVPVGIDNAVQMVSFGIEWALPLDAETLRALSVLHSVVEADLPRKQEINGASFNFTIPSDNGNIPQISQISPAQSLTGLIFDALAPDGSQSAALTIQPTFMATWRTGYAGWIATWDKARRLLVPFMSAMLNYRPLSVIGQQFVNAFRIEGDADQFRAQMIFSEESKFLPANIFEATSFWHSHHGFFVDSTTPAPHRLLSTINVDFTEENGGKLIRITTAHRAMLSTQLTEGDATEVEALLDRWGNHLHDIHKNCLKNLLTPQVGTEIGLYRD
jgi:hypothetical protein